MLLTNTDARTTKTAGAPQGSRRYQIAALLPLPSSLRTFSGFQAISLPLLFPLLLLLNTVRLAPAQVEAIQRTRISGTITSVKPGELTIETTAGETLQCKIQDTGQRAISINGQPVRLPAKIFVTGKLPIDLVERDMLVAFQGRSTVDGKAEGEVQQIQLLLDDQTETKMDFLERPKEIRDAAKVDVVGRVINFSNQRLQLAVPKARWARREQVYFPMAKDASIAISDDSLSRVVAGDRVRDAEILTFASGELAIRSIDIELTADRQQLSRSFDDELERKFAHLSDQPQSPREIRSEHFLLSTDVSDRSANILLGKLESIYHRVSNYYRTRPDEIIHCYVIRDLNQWSSHRLDPRGIAKVRQGAGVTISQQQRNGTRAVVYAGDNHGIVQHEAVHAFCAQTFGSTGPVWYAEGMAEMGAYWTPGNLEVNIDPVVIEYLSATQPKQQMMQIIEAEQITGDSWKAYAWRWALCHLLASNPNYQRRFKALGINLMSGNEDSFEKAFGKRRNRISFEYDQFVRNFGNGYRVDLCAWDWKTRSRKISLDEQLKHEIRAAAGWQATELYVEPDQTYEYVAQGKWRTQPDQQSDANGRADGTGRLIGALLENNELSEPFELGTRGSFALPSAGHLFVRCGDDWTELSDNEGEITLHLRKSRLNED